MAASIPRGDRAGTAKRASAASMHSPAVTSGTTCDVVTASPLRSRLRLRSSMGSMPSFFASRSIIPS